MKFNYKSRKGFTLIELLVVIGILAVLAAIAIPSVAGLIDRANVSADKTNSNEMTNAMERFASEYELFYQDIASGTFDKDNMDSAQGRVYNVLGIEDRAGIELVEIGADEPVDDNAIAIYRDTKYPANAKTAQLIVQNYTKTSSSTFEPKQSDMHYWYSPDCGVVVFAEPDADQDKENKLNNQIQSGQDAKGKKLGADTQWIDLTANFVTNSISLPDKGKSLQEYTWEEIHNIAVLGKTAEYGFKVGDTKTLSINGNLKTATIVGINHDCNNSITFMVVGDIKRFHSDIAQSWEETELRAWLNNDFYNSLDIKQYIKEVTKSTYVNQTSSYTVDKIFLPSTKEVGLSTNTNDTSVIYEYFNTPQHGTHTHREYSGVLIPLRTPSGDGRWLSINSQTCDGVRVGWTGYTDATSNLRIYPMFVIG